jgi:hypothetical protein
MMAEKAQRELVYSEAKLSVGTLALGGLQFLRRSEGCAPASLFCEYIVLKACKFYAACNG